MTMLGLFLITLGVIVGVHWMWILGIVIATLAVVSTLSGKHTRIVAGRAHYI